MTDEEFQLAIDMMLSGNSDGLKNIYQEYIKLIYVTIYNIVGSKEDAEDLSSEFFIKLVRVAGGYKQGNGHRTWLVTIARNMALDHLRKRKNEVLASTQENDETANDYLDSVNENAAQENPVEEKAMLSQDMQAAMKTLTPNEKEIVDLKLIGQFKFKEISQMLGQPMGTVTWVYNQAIKKLRRCLADYE